MENNEDRKGDGDNNTHDDYKDGKIKRGGGIGSRDKKKQRKQSPDDRPRKRRRASEDDDKDERRRQRLRKKDYRKGKKNRKTEKGESRRRRDERSSSSSLSSSSSSSSSNDEPDDRVNSKHTNNNNNARNEQRLLAKLLARGETLEERQARRAQLRASQIEAKLGYTALDNPFNDPNLTEPFTWNKKKAKNTTTAKARMSISTSQEQQHAVIKGGSSALRHLEEIEKVRKRRQDRQDHFEEMERIRAQESRMKELENYDDWARKEEEFHLNQQRHRSAIRLVQGREKPIDVLAKNIMLLAGSDSEQQQRQLAATDSSRHNSSSNNDANSAAVRVAVKYHERYKNAMEQVVESLEAELEEPPVLLKMLKLHELEELLVDIDAFRKLELEASSSFSSTVGSANSSNNNNTNLQYWDNLRLVAMDEIEYLTSGGSSGRHAKMVSDVNSIFEGQSMRDLLKMKDDVKAKLQEASTVHPNSDTVAIGSGACSGKKNNAFDRDYWLFVQDQLLVHFAKSELSEIHSKMLVRQLERLEAKKDELARKTEATGTIGVHENGEKDLAGDLISDPSVGHQENPTSTEFGDLEEELGLEGEIELPGRNYSWQDRYRPRKPRYFNRVKTGYDWNKYNQTHYDRDNPPPKIVQGYKFNVFYPDLIDATKTPQFYLEPADVGEFCIIRFRAGPPYEDLAFKIVNREWNRSRKRGFKSTFERGVLSLYFNFTTHWYRK